MLRNALFIARKDLKYSLRQRETILWTFIMPIIFFYFIGTITGGMGNAGGSSTTRIALETGQNAGFLAEELSERLEALDFTVSEPESEETFAAASRRLSIPADFTDTVLAGQQVTLQYHAADSSGLGGDFDEIRLQRAIYTLIADMIVATEHGEALSTESFQRVEDLPRFLTLEVSRAGKRKKIPNGFEQAIPGTMVMFTLLVLLSSGAVLLVVERRQGLLRRLASSPMSRGSVVLGKWGGKVVLGLIQIAFAMLAGTLIFKMDWGPEWPMLLLVLAAWASLCASLGMLLGCLARSEGQAVGLGVVSANVLAALGGCWWPIEITPSWMQSLANWLPTGWAMHAMHQLVNFGAPALGVLPSVLAIFAAATIIGVIAARVFRFS